MKVYILFFSLFFQFLAPLYAHWKDEFDQSFQITKINQLYEGLKLNKLEDRNFYRSKCLLNTHRLQLPIYLLLKQKGTDI